MTPLRNSISQGQLLRAGISIRLTKPNDSLRSFLKVVSCDALKYKEDTPISRHDKALGVFREGAYIPAIPLVLDASRRFDEAGQRRLVRYYLDAGAGGVAAAVHTTQFAIRDPQVGLFEPVLEAVRDAVDKFEAGTGKTAVRIAGACGGAEQAAAEAKTAKKYGFDAVLLSPGGLADLSEDDLLERTRAVAEILPVVGFYLQPSVGGRVFSYQYWRSLCEIGGVIGIKCAPFNRYQTLDVVRAAALSKRSGDIALYTGNDDSIVVDLLTTFRFGGVDKRFVGGLLGHWAVCAKAQVRLFHEIKEAAKQPSIPSSLLTLAAEVTDFNAAVFDAANGFAGCIAGVHEVLRRQGLMEGIWCLNPGETLSPGQAEEIGRVMAAYPHLAD